MAICFVLIAFAAFPPPVQAEGLTRVSSVVRADAKSGRLVRTVVRRSRESSAPDVQPAKAENRSGTLEVGRIVQQAAANHGVDPTLVHSVIQVESGYNPYAVSPKGAQGLMQLIPATARRFGVSNSFDARQNIEAGVKYLRYLQDMFKNDRLALAAYNAGEGAVLKYGGIPPYAETERYVKRVGEKLGEARRRSASEMQAVVPANAQALEAESMSNEAAVRSLDAFTDEAGRLHLRTREDSPSP